ncbi:hypothetical protein HK100_009423, partial [Physocladia obscura]
MEIDVEAEQKAIRNSLMMVDSEVTARNLNRNSDVLIRSIIENGAENNTNGSSHSNSTTKQTKASRHTSSSSRLSIQALSDLGDGEEEAVTTATKMTANANTNKVNNASNVKRNKPHAPLPSAIVATAKRQSDFELFPGLGLNIGDRSSIASSLSITTTVSVNATSSINSRNADSASDRNTNTNTNSMAVDSPHSDLDLQVAAVLVDQRSFIPAITNQNPPAQYTNYNNSINPQLVFHQQLQQQQIYQSETPLSQPHYQATPTPPATSQMDMQTPRQQTPLIPQLQQMGPDDDDDAMIDDLYDHVRDTFGRLHSSTSTSAKSPAESHQQYQEQQLFQQQQMPQQQQNLHQHSQYHKYTETEQPAQISWMNGNQTSAAVMHDQYETGDNEDEDVNTKRSSTRRIMSLFRAAEAAARDAELEERARTNVIQISAHQGGIQNQQPQQLYYQQDQTYQQQQQYERQVSVSTTDFDSDGDSDGRFGSMGGSQHEESVANTPPSNLLPFVCDICSRAFLRKHDLKRHVLTTHGTADAFK